MKKTKFFSTFSLLFLLIFAESVEAGPKTDALSKCLGDNTTGKNRKDLVRWFFTSLSVHQDIHDLTKVTDETRANADKIVAALIERLITEACREESKAAFKEDGQDTFRVAFRTLGELSANELLANPLVNKATTGFSKYIDTKKIDAILK